MLEPITKSIVAVAVIVSIWLLVQAAWQRVFAAEHGGSPPGGWSCDGCRRQADCQQRSRPRSDCDLD